MPGNRTVALVGEWAKDAPAPPQNPIKGDTYAAAVVAQAVVKAGWPFGTIVDSAQFNAFMRQMTQLMLLLQEWGVLPWRALSTYQTGAHTLGSDGQMYRALQETTGNDPTTQPSAYWLLIDTGAHAILTDAHGATPTPTANRFAMYDADLRLKSGAAPAAATDVWRKTEGDAHADLTNPHSSVSDATANRLALRDASGRCKFAAGEATGDAVVFSQFAASKAANGHQPLPGGIIFQWGSSAVINASQLGTVTFPLAFPTACFVVVPNAFAAAAWNSTLTASLYSFTASQATFRNQDDNTAIIVQYIAIGW